MTGRTVATLLMTAMLAAPTFAADGVFDAETTAFLAEAETSELATMGVLYRGRLAVLDTVAREQLGRVGLEDLPADVSPSAAFLELYFNAGDYLDRPVLAVSSQPLIQAMAERLDEQTAATLRDTHRLPPACLVDEQALETMLSAGRATMDDYRRSADVPSLAGALGELSSQPGLRLPMERLAAGYGAFLGRGLSAAACVGEGRWTAADNVLAGSDRVAPEVIDAWRALRDAWRRRDADGVSSAARGLAEVQKALAGERYASATVRKAEILYNRMGQFSFVWVGFAVAIVLWIPATVRSRRRFRLPALALMGLSALLLAVAFVIRWLISGRGWHMPPVLNQFEAVTASALLAAVIALALEVWRKRGALGLAGSFYAAVAMLCAFWMPGRMGADVAATHGLLDSPLMAAHVGVIIAGHAAVGMSFVISLVYLMAAAVRGRASELARDIDRCNVIVVHIATWTLALGIVLGALWGDVAWGRWWGWDAKETWALITLLVYITTIHVRLAARPRRRALLTAVGCVIATAVMLFNWIVVNYYLTELHGYA
ncbi:MAG: cytochrome c biogenesis protein [Phycisphaerae bacterium]